MLGGVELAQDALFHHSLLFVCKGSSFDGVVGRDPIFYARYHRHQVMEEIPRKWSHGVARTVRDRRTNALLDNRTSSMGLGLGISLGFHTALISQSRSVRCEFGLYSRCYGHYRKSNCICLLHLVAS